jgi:hypothetical protein
VLAAYKSGRSAPPWAPKTLFSFFATKTFPPAASNGAYLQQQVGGAQVADAMRRAEELAVQQPGDPAAFMAATEALVQADEEKRVGEALVLVNQRTRSVVGSR